MRRALRPAHYRDRRPALIPFKPEEDLLSLLLPVAVLLVLLLAAAAAALWWARRSGRAIGVPGRQRRLKVLERLPVSRGAALVLVEYDGRVLLIGQSGDRLSLIDARAGGE